MNEPTTQTAWVGAHPAYVLRTPAYEASLAHIEGLSWRLTRRKDDRRVGLRLEGFENGDLCEILLHIDGKPREYENVWDARLAGEKVTFMATYREAVVFASAEKMAINGGEWRCPREHLRTVCGWLRDAAADRFPDAGPRPVTPIAARGDLQSLLTTPRKT